MHLGDSNGLGDSGNRRRLKGFALLDTLLLRGLSSLKGLSVLSLLLLLEEFGLLSGDGLLLLLLRLGEASLGLIKHIEGSFNGS